MKMVDDAVLNAALTQVANAIRAKTGSQATMTFPNGMVSEIEGIQPKLETKSITENGTYTPSIGKDGFSSVTVDVEPEPVFETDYGFNFYDYNGLLIDSWPHSVVQSKQSLPVLPVNSGLISEGWNWTLQEIKDYDINAGSIKYTIAIGNVVVPSDGATKINMILCVDQTEIFIILASNGNTVVSWGDGSNTTISGSYTSPSSASFQEVSHIYTSKGKYTISINCRENEEYTFKHASPTVSSSSYLPFINSRSPDYRKFSVESINFGSRLSTVASDFGLSNYYYVFYLTKYVTYPSNITEFGTYTFGNGSYYNGSIINIVPRGSKLTNSMNKVFGYTSNNNISNKNNILSLPKNIQIETGIEATFSYEAYMKYDLSKCPEAFLLSSSDAILFERLAKNGHYNKSIYTKFMLIDDDYPYPEKSTEYDFTDTSIYNPNIEKIIFCPSSYSVQNVKVNSEWFETQYSNGYISGGYGYISNLEILENVNTLRLSEYTYIRDNNYNYGDIKFYSSTPPAVDSSWRLTYRSNNKFIIPFESLYAYKTASNYYPNITNYIGFNNYETVQTTLPTVTADNRFLLTWYGTLTDAKASTNPITSGSGLLYCRYVSNAPAIPVSITSAGYQNIAYIYSNTDTTRKYSVGSYSYSSEDVLKVRFGSRWGMYGDIEYIINGTTYHTYESEHEESISLSSLENSVSVRFYLLSYGMETYCAEITYS